MRSFFKVLKFFDLKLRVGSLTKVDIFRHALPSRHSANGIFWRFFKIQTEPLRFKQTLCNQKLSFKNGLETIRFGTLHLSKTHHF